MPNDLTIDEKGRAVAPEPRRTRRGNETSQMLAIIERAATDPAVDMDKLERLIRMRKEIVEDQAEKAFIGAMNAAQAEMKTIAADAENKQTSSKYATYAKLDRVLRPIYTKHGFSLSFDEADSTKPDHVRIICLVSHEDGHTRTYRKDMPTDGKGARGGAVMSTTHATGAASSYGARYLLKGIFNIAVGEEDRDGNPAPEGPAGFLSPDQIEELRTLINDFDAEEAKVVSIVTQSDATTLEEMPARFFGQAKAQLNAFARRQREKGLL